MNEREQIKLLALGLDIGQTLRAICPYCNAEHETSLAITRKPDGLAFICPRAKCGRRGFISSRTTNYDPHWHKQTPRIRQPKVFTYETEALSQEIKEMFYDRYNITETELEENGFRYSPEMDRVIMPVYNSLGYEVGKVARAYGADFTGTKAINYFDDGKPHLHYVPSALSRGGAITCVEDIPSAIRCARFGRTAAILGSHLTDEFIIELGGLTTDLILALDPDATYKAFELRQKYKLYFKNFWVKVLSKDPKDMTDEEIQEEIF